MNYLRPGFSLCMLGLFLASCSKKDNTTTEELQEVKITAFTEHAQGGATITINGSGFSDKIAENIVTINERPATVTAAMPNLLSVTVPAKAGNGKIKVTVGSKNAVSANLFIYDWVYTVSTLTGDGTSAKFSRPSGLVTDGDGNVYFADEYVNKIFKVTPTGTLSVLAGGGTPGFRNGNGANALFNAPAGLTLDASGNVYVADRSNHLIRKITPNGDVSTWAGDGITGYLDFPTGIDFDDSGNMIVTAQNKYKVMKITPNGDGSRSIVSIAGSTYGYADGNAATAKFAMPTYLAVDGSNIFVSDLTNNRIRKISGGTVSTIGGDGNQTTLFNPVGIDIDKDGNIYTTDKLNYRIRKITTAADGSTTISTIAGSGNSGYADGIGTSAQFIEPLGLAIDKNGNIYIGDGSKPRIRKIAMQ